MSLEKLLDQQHREVQSLTREQLVQLDQTLEQARQDLGNRLADERQRHGNERFTAQRLKATRQQVEAAIAQTSQLLGRQVSDNHATARALADGHVDGQAREVESRGVAQRLDIQTSLKLAEPDSTLIERGQGLANGYSRETVRALKARLSLATLTGQTTDEVIEDLVKPGGLLEGERYRARRIVQTEIAYAYNRRIYQQIKARGAKKRLLNILDNRTAPDTLAIIALPGNLVRDVDDPFVDPTTGRKFQYPPNRPNDRATIAVFFNTDREQQAVDREREKAEKLATPSEKKKAREEEARKLRERARKAQAERDARAKDAARKRKAQPTAPEAPAPPPAPAPPGPPPSVVAPPATQIPRAVEFTEWKLDDDQLHIGPQAPPKLNERGLDELDRIAEEIRDQEHEHAYVIDTDGNPLGTGTNRSANMVAMQPFDDAGALNGNVFIHNHPRGNPPSSSDLVKAAQYKVAEFRIVTNHRIGDRFIGYVVRPDRFQAEATTGGRNDQILRLRDELQSLALYYGRIQRKPVGDRDWTDQDIRASTAIAMATARGLRGTPLLHHLAMIDLARYYGFGYWIELR